MEDVNTRLLSFSFPELRYSLLEFDSRKNCQDLTNFISAIKFESARRHFLKELKQQRWRRLRKRHLKGDVARLQTLSRFFHLVIKIRQMLAIFSGVQLKDCIEIQGKKNKAVVLCSSSPQKVNLGIFTSVVYVQ